MTWPFIISANNSILPESAETILVPVLTMDDIVNVTYNRGIAFLLTRNNNQII